MRIDANSSEYINFEFGEIKKTVRADSLVLLTNGVYKIANEITIDDDVDIGSIK